jgi:hypothetical protein
MRPDKGVTTLKVDSQDISVHQVIDWHEQVRHFSAPTRELLVHSIALQARTRDRPTLRILLGPKNWPQLTEQLRVRIGVSIGMGMVGVRRYGRVTFEQTASEPLTTRVWSIGG